MKFEACNIHQWHAPAYTLEHVYISLRRWYPLLTTSPVSQSGYSPVTWLDYLTKLSSGIQHLAGSLNLSLAFQELLLHQNSLELE